MTYRTQIAAFHIGVWVGVPTAVVLVLVALNQAMG